MDNPTLLRHQTQRIRRETRRRNLTVSTVERLTPQMQRVVFTSPDLHDFESASADDHVKLFLPGPVGADGKPEMRDYTPRSFDTAKGVLTIDFALHEAGPATAWALSAKVGDSLSVGGPRGSAVVPDDFDWYLLIGDETALPAMGRRVEELRPGVPVTTVAVIDSDADRQVFAGKADWTGIWVVRNGQGDDTALLRAAIPQLPPGEGYVWIAAEAMVARALRAHVIDDLGHPMAWTKAAGYWTRGAVAEHTSIND